MQALNERGGKPNLGKERVSPLARESNPSSGGSSRPTQSLAQYGGSPNRCCSSGPFSSSRDVSTVTQ